MKLFLLITALGCSVLQAGSAAYLADGKRVIRCSEKGLLLKSLVDFSEVPVKYPKGFSPGWSSVTRLPEGEILVAGGAKAMTWDPSSGKWDLFCTAPKEKTFEDVACDPKSGKIVFICGDDERHIIWYVWENEKKMLVHVFNRRAGGAEYPVFDVEGNLYFCREGDIWKGSLDCYEEKNKTRAVLSGSRIWPLGEHETYDGNTSGVGAEEVAPMTGWLLVTRKRMNGSGWGSLVRVPNADAYKEHLPLKWERLEDVGGGGLLALSPDGKQSAAYITAQHRWFLLEKPDGELLPLSSSEKK